MNAKAEIKQFLSDTLSKLVDSGEVRVEMKTAPGEQTEAVLYSVYPRRGEFGMVIGRGGKIINAVRALASALASRHRVFVTIEVIEP